MDMAEATFDRLTQQQDPAADKIGKEEDEGYIAMISHPFFEAVRLLRIFSAISQIFPWFSVDFPLIIWLSGIWCRSPSRCCDPSTSTSWRT
jgi:hypothetical protein